MNSNRCHRTSLLIIALIVNRGLIWSLPAFCFYLDWNPDDECGSRLVSGETGWRYRRSAEEGYRTAGHRTFFFFSFSLAPYFYDSFTSTFTFDCNNLMNRLSETERKSRWRRANSSLATSLFLRKATLSLLMPRSWPGTTIKMALRFVSPSSQSTTSHKF